MSLASKKGTVVKNYLLVVSVLSIGFFNLSLCMLKTFPPEKNKNKNENIKYFQKICTSLDDSVTYLEKKKAWNNESVKIIKEIKKRYIKLKTNFFYLQKHFEAENYEKCKREEGEEYEFVSAPKKIIQSCGKFFDPKKIEMRLNKISDPIPEGYSDEE